MSTIKRYAPFSLLSAFAAGVALVIAWEPGEAEANRPAQDSPVLRSSIVEAGNLIAPDCPDAVWPYVTKDCLLHPDAFTAERKVRGIVIDDRTIIQHRAILDQIVYGL